ncbi:unnamed protein product [Cunninghamella blakesleeana]
MAIFDSPSSTITEGSTSNPIVTLFYTIINGVFNYILYPIGMVFYFGLKVLLYPFYLLISFFILRPLWFIIHVCQILYPVFIYLFAAVVIGLIIGLCAGFTSEALSTIIINATWGPQPNEKLLTYPEEEEEYSEEEEEYHHHHHSYPYDQDQYYQDEGSEIYEEHGSYEDEDNTNLDELEFNLTKQQDIMNKFGLKNKKKYNMDYYSSSDFDYNNHSDDNPINHLKSKKVSSATMGNLSEKQKGKLAMNKKNEYNQDQQPSPTLPSSNKKNRRNSLVLTSSQNSPFSFSPISKLSSSSSSSIIKNENNKTNNNNNNNNNTNNNGLLYQSHSSSSLNGKDSWQWTESEDDDLNWYENKSHLNQPVSS